MKRYLPVRPSLTYLRHQAKALVREVQAGSPQAILRCRERHPRCPSPGDLSLSDAQLVIAREYGFAGWPKLKHHVEALEGAERRVSAIRGTFAEGDAETRRRLLKAAHDPARFENYDPDAASISEGDARLLVANQEGYAFWQKYDAYLHLDPSVRGVIAAVRSGDRQRLLEILRDEPWASNPAWVAGFVPPQPTPNDSIPLFCVSEGWHRGTNVRGNQYDLIRDLVNAGAEIEIEGGTPLAAAVSFGVIRTVEALLDCGAAVDGVDRDGAPLAYALHFGYVEIAGLLAQRGATLDLRFAAGLGMLDAVKSWFNADGSLKPGAGALVDPYALERKLRGESPFRCERTRDNILSQALYFACTHRRLDVAGFLLSQGADVNAIVPGLDARATVLHRVAAMDAGGRRMRWTMEHVVRFLVDHGADLTIRDEEYGGTPLGWARYARRDEAVELLRSLGASD